MTQTATPSQPTASDLTPVTVDSRFTLAHALFVKIKRFRTYDKNWGTYGEKAVKAAACDQAEHFISQFVFWRPLVKLDVYPTIEGHIGVTWDFEGSEYAAIFSGEIVELWIDEECQDVPFPNEAHLLKYLKLTGFDGLI